ncbi:MAG TPA: hypothetical protein VFD37_00285 [Solirubrobacterales bacterium]|nr:hypothetical protein [Solirubrobacterales bacterium]
MRREVPYTTLDGHNVSLQISERYAPDAADRALVNFLAPLDGRLILDLDSHGPGRLRMELAEAGGPVLKRMDRPSPYFRFSSTICGVREHLVTIEAGARRVRYRLTAYVP